MIRDELHSEPSALRIDDRDQTSRHISSQYANSAIALRGAKTVKQCKVSLNGCYCMLFKKPKISFIFII